VLGVGTIPDEAKSRAVMQAYGADAPFNEWNIFTRTPAAPKTRLGRSILMLALLYGKWRGRLDDDGMRGLAAIVGEEVCLLTSFGWLDEWLLERSDWRTAIGRLFHWLAIRHDEVKFQKHNLDASWLEMAGGLFFKQQDIVPDFRSSRHWSAVTILQDLGIFEHADVNGYLQLTAEGRDVLAKASRSDSS
jgi:hypothetical protein